MFVEFGYSGVMGEHLQTQLLDYNQLNPSYLTAIRHRGNSIIVLNSKVGSRSRMQSASRAPFASFARLWGSRGTVAQALRPYPQYNVIDTYAGQGDHSGHSTYNALYPEVPEALLSWVDFAVVLCVLEAADRFRLGVG